VPVGFAFHSPEIRAIGSACPAAICVWTQVVQMPAVGRFGECLGERHAAVAALLEILRMRPLISTRIRQIFPAFERKPRSDVIWPR
jgi:hypothetical protein